MSDWSELIGFASFTGFPRASSFGKRCRATASEETNANTASIHEDILFSVGSGRDGVGHHVASLLATDADGVDAGVAAVADDNPRQVARTQAINGADNGIIERVQRQVSRHVVRHLDGQVRLAAGRNQARGVGAQDDL